MKNTFAFSDNILGILIDSEINEIKMTEIQEMLNEKLQHQEQVSIYIEDQYNKGISLAAFLKSMAFHYTHNDSIRKVAIVTDLKWFQKLMNVKDYMVKAEVKTFDLRERMNAMNWIME